MRILKRAGRARSLGIFMLMTGITFSLTVLGARNSPLPGISNTIALCFGMLLGIVGRPILNTRRRISRWLDRGDFVFGEYLGYCVFLSCPWRWFRRQAPQGH